MAYNCRLPDLADSSCCCIASPVHSQFLSVFNHLKRLLDVFIVILTFLYRCISRYLSDNKFQPCYSTTRIKAGRNRDVDLFVTLSVTGEMVHWRCGGLSSAGIMSDQRRPATFVLLDVSSATPCGDFRPRLSDRPAAGGGAVCLGISEH